MLSRFSFLYELIPNPISNPCLIFFGSKLSYQTKLKQSYNKTRLAHPFDCADINFGPILISIIFLVQDAELYHSTYRRPSTFNTNGQPFILVERAFIYLLKKRNGNNRQHKCFHYLTSDGHSEYCKILNFSYLI